MRLKFVGKLLDDRNSREGRGIAERAECSAQHVTCEVSDQNDVAARSLPFMETGQKLSKPGSAFAARDTPSTAFVRVKPHDAKGRLHHTRVFVHHYYAARPK